MIFFKSVFSLAFSLGANFLLETEKITNEAIQGLDLANKFVLAVIFAPLMETFIFQFLVIEGVLFLSKILNFSYGELISIFFSSVLFSLTHNYSIHYIIYAFISGLIFAFFYVFARKRNGMNGYITVVIVHGFSNFTGFVYEILTS